MQTVTSCEWICYTILVGTLTLFDVNHCLAQVTVDLFPAKDNSIYSENNNSNALGDLFVGRASTTSGGARRRCLVKFDLTSIPSTATVSSVTLTMTKNQGGSGSTSLHKLEEDWGEGTSSAGPGGPGSGGGKGAPPTTDDATWNYRFWQTQLWTTAGGEFSGSPSATTVVGAANTTYTWNGMDMTADVQNWVETSSMNFGWIIVGDESTTGTTSRFNSREDISGKPTLEVTYTTAPCPDSIMLIGIIPSGTYQANQFIQASGTVKDTSDVVFKSGGEVLLDLNFNVEIGGNFRIEQEGCN
ncbi:MAG: DNRLRE domain-containing protein [Saprospiraceae bacterium]|nr:DNRLRE domain-containing protein [Saprospiraceae bacterium]